MSLANAPDTAGWHGPLEVRITFETVLGLLAAFFIGFFAPVIFGLLAVFALVGRRMDLLWAALPLTIGTGWLAVLIARMAADASMGRVGGPYDRPLNVDFDLPPLKLPFALAMAAQLPQFSWFWRPWLGFWWIGHFAVAALAGHAVAIKLVHKLDPAALVATIPLSVLIHFAFLFAANLYLILAARAFAPSPRLCILAWRYRYLIDFILALALLLRNSR